VRKRAGEIAVGGGESNKNINAGTLAKKFVFVFSNKFR
jgi:hypothetical protein